MPLTGATPIIGPASKVHKQVGVGCIYLRLRKAGCAGCHGFDSPNMSVYRCCLGPESPIPLAYLKDHGT